MSEDYEPYVIKPSEGRPRRERRNWVERTADILWKIGGMTLAGSVVSYLAWAAWAMFNVMVRDRVSAPDIGALFLLMTLFGAFLVVVSVFVRYCGAEFGGRR